MRDLSKPIAALLTVRLHPRLIRVASAVHLALLRRFARARMVGGETLVLTTRGRRSGQPRSTPLFYARRDGHLYLAASFAGRDAPPNWYRNLLADPVVGLDIAGQHGSYVARVLEPSEAATIWPLLVAHLQALCPLQQRTKRPIAVIELTRQDPAPSSVESPAIRGGEPYGGRAQ